MMARVMWEWALRLWPTQYAVEVTLEKRLSDAEVRAFAERLRAPHA
jgi:hypothetical protein